MAEGYELLFTVEETLSVLSGGYVEASTLGRIGIDVPAWLADEEDWLPEIAWRLFTRPRSRPVVSDAFARRDLVGAPGSCYRSTPSAGG